MRTVVFQAFGGPELLRVIERDIPVAGPGEVVVRVAAATVNPTDLLMRSGKQAALMTGLVPPYIAGMEFAGQVHQIGPGDSRLQPGQPVMGIVNPRRLEGGAHAEFVCVPTASVAPLPEGTDLVAAATVPMNGLTAKMALEALALPPGASLLVTGGAGAVGGYVIQLAKAAGLRIVTDAKDAAQELVRELGADEVVPRGKAMAAAVRSLYPAGVDGLVDTALLGAEASALVRDGGAVAWVRRANAGTDARLRHHVVGVLDQAANTAALDWLAERLRAGALKPRVAVRLPFERADEAHRLVEQGGLRGRVVLVP